MYGSGAYLTEHCTKADEYAKDEQGGYYDGIYAMLLCRTCLGKVYYTTKRDPKAHDHVKDGRHDSTLGDRMKFTGTFREFVVYDADQIYPEYVVLYRRIMSNDDVAEVQAKAGKPFHMELPIYWWNCYKSPRLERFNEQYYVSGTTLTALQELAKSSGLAKSPQRVRRARRVEHSEMWNRYASIKTSLQSKLEGRGLERFPAPEALGRNPHAGYVLTAAHMKKLGLEDTVSLDNLDESVGEHLLWHGTSKEHAETIIVDDFHINKSEVKHGSRFGVGAYFAEDLEKSLQYAAEDSDAKKWVLLCRVLCGDMYYTEENVETNAVNSAGSDGKDSVLANPKGLGPREFIVPSSDQVYPEYILELSTGDASLATESVPAPVGP